MSRYRGKRIFDNTEESYKDLMDSRGIEKIRHYETNIFINMKKEDYAQITQVAHTWTVGDRFYKLSYKYYGTTEYWWVIARYNRLPTEAHVKLGQRVNIPLPIGKVLHAFGA